ncbi:MAG: alkaline phosphatase family protein [Cyanobacteria bacterium SZAS-4]|nr:alkaline phosphatase family protein [Cyanobacteria bacterium SZAS-4]
MVAIQCLNHVLLQLSRLFQSASKDGFRRITALALGSMFLCLQVSPVQAQSSPSRPKLVVLLIADQFSYNYIPRYLDKFTSGGIKLLMDRGATFTDCKFANASTQTAVGHSIISTGAYPWATGIVGDDWYDRRKNKPISAVSDEAMKVVGANGTGSSSHFMQGTTIGDQMKLATNGRSKVVTISLEDRSALLLAGKLANGAYWWDTKTGAFVTSAQFGTELAGWAQAFNDTHYADKYLGKPWQRLLPETQYTASTHDDYPHEKGIAGDGKQFPHVITGGANAPGEAYYSAFAMTPWSNQMICDFAKEAIDKENLGLHTDPDMLSISFSAGELLGGAFGPYSQEVEDLTLRLDQSISGLIQHIDQKVGLDNCLIVFTADHGVAPIPEFLKERGMDSSRIDVKNFKTALDSQLDARLGPEDWVESFEPPNLYLNLNAIDRQKYRQPDVEALSAKMAHSIAGVGEVYTAAQFFTNQLPSGPLMDAVRKSYYWGRSGELFVMPRPGHIFISESTGTATGSPYNYDTQVPLIMSGSNVQNGRFGQSSSPADIAPTITTILGIEQPSLCEGRVLTEALSGNSRGR